MSAGWTEIREPTSSPVTAVTVAHGPLIPPQQQLLLYSPDQWEGFVHEWAYYCLKNQYRWVQRFSGSGDRGNDIAGFADDKRLLGVWDNYQCKHYAHALTRGDIWSELGKVLWYALNGEYRVPRRYYFVAPKGVGTSLAALLPKDRDGICHQLANEDRLLWKQ